ncbi:tail fiber domain-containing protein [Bacteroidota bacterium]
MRKLLLLSAIIVLSIYCAIGQAPEKMNYQGVLRNSSGELVENTSIGVRISLLEGSSTGTLVFSETHSVSTNDYGQFSIQIGTGTLESGDFSTVNWAGGQIYLKTEVDENGGTTYTELSTVQLVTVPYAMYANDVANKDDADADPANEIQDLDLTSNILTITNNASATPINLAPYSGTNTDEQILNLVGTDLSITGGNTVDLSPIQDGVDDADNDASNEIQDLDLTSNILTITNNPSATQIDLAPYSGTNTDEQSLSLTGTDLSITGGNTVDLSTIQDGVDDADNSITNELQTLILEGDTLEISNGNSIIFPYDSSSWVTSGSDIYYNTGNVGIGSSNPVSNLEVKATAASSKALFQVINANNDTVFAVYPDGVKVFVNPDAKGKVGGFAISGKSPDKAGEIDYMRVTGDSTRIYVNEPAAGKGKVGGFAISGRSPGKGIIHDYLVVTNDSTRIYVNDTATVKGKVGGFAISGRSPSKGTLNDYLQVTRDSTRVYVTEDAGKGNVGGFAISGRSPSKGVSRKFMDMTKKNYFIGHESGQNISDGLYNAFMGYQSGQANTTGSLNAFYGYQAGYSNTIGNNNTFLGDSAGYSNTDGDYNTFIGFGAGSKNTTGVNNSFLGSFSGYSNTFGSYNTFAGDSAGFSNTIGNENSFYGDKAGLNNIDGSNNIFVGNLSGYSNIGDSCVFIGNRSGYVNEGLANVFIGNRSGYSNSSGKNNVFSGYMSGYKNTSGMENVFLGTKAGYSNAGGNFNVFLGFEAGFKNSVGSSNVFIGRLAGFDNTSGLDNVFIGTEAGSANTTAGKNIFIGKWAGYVNNTGSQNIFIGYNSGMTNESGGGNVFMGNWSGRLNTGSNNTMLGFYAGDGNTTGNSNQFIGLKAGFKNEAGYENVYLGVNAGQNNKSGNYNVFIGNDAGDGFISPSYTASYSVMIGYRAGYKERASSRLYIESSDADSSGALIYGRFDDNWVRINDSLGIGRNPGAFAFEVEGDAYKTDGTTAWNTPSDRRIKTDIQDIENALETILKLRPVKYKFTKEWKEKHPSLKDQYYYNFIAQEYQQVFPESVMGSGEFINEDPNEVLIMNDQNAQIITIKAVQDLIKENDIQKAELQNLNTEIKELKSENEELNQKLNEIIQMLKKE